MVSLQCEIIKSTPNLMTQTLHLTAFIWFKNVADKSQKIQENGKVIVNNFDFPLCLKSPNVFLCLFQKAHMK